MFVFKNRSVHIALIGFIIFFMVFPLHVFGLLIPLGVSVARAENRESSLVIEFIPIVRAEAGKPLEIIVNIESDSSVMSPTVFYRTRGESRYQKIRMKRNKDTFVATIPGSATVGDGVEYYITATDMYDNLASEGDAGKPHFASVKIEDFEGPVIDHKSVKHFKEGQQVVIKADLEDKSEIKNFRLYFKNANDTNYAELQMRKNAFEGYYEAIIPASEIKSENIEYYLEASDIVNNESNIGSEHEPIIARSDAAKRVNKPWYKKPLIWTAIVAVAGGIAAASSSGGGSSTSAGAPTMGSVVIQ